MMRKTRVNDLEQYAQLFRALADATRLQILFTLADGEQSVSGLSEILGLPQPLVSHHLGLLRVLNLVTRRREGKRVLYGVDPYQESVGNVVISAVRGMLEQPSQKQLSA